VTKQKPSEPSLPSLASILDLSGALEELAAPACVIDRDGRYRWLNRAYIELF
jgi:PAS domain-containing protein